MKWITLKTIYVDLQTGEEIKDTSNHIILRKTKKIIYNDKRTRATIQHIGECQRNKQGKLF